MQPASVFPHIHLHRSVSHLETHSLNLWLHLAHSLFSDAQRSAGRMHVRPELQLPPGLQQGSNGPPQVHIPPEQVSPPPQTLLLQQACDVCPQVLIAQLRGLRGSTLLSVNTIADNAPGGSETNTGVSTKLRLFVSPVKPPSAQLAEIPALTLVLTTSVDPLLNMAVCVQQSPKMLNSA